MTSNQGTKIGIIGTGFIGEGLLKTIGLLPNMGVSCVLTRRNPTNFSDQDLYTNSVDQLIDCSEVVVECSGDPVYSTEILLKVMQAGLPVVTMDAELHVTTGSYLSQQGFITEAEGDQPGTLAALHRDIVTMGFKPLVYGNLKGFLNHYPTLEEMQHWSSVQGISLEQVTGFTDGTKLQIEQVLVANGLGAKIAIQGMYGYISEDIQEGSIRLAEQAKEMGAPISDYLLCHPQAKKRFPAGVFITAEYDHRQAAALRYLKLGDGPFYTLIRNYHLCHLEIPKTIRQVIQGDGVLLNNSDHPSASVAVISKTLLKPGTRITRSGRNFLVRGEAIPIDAVPNHVPIGLMSNAVITRAVEPGQMILFDYVEIADSLAYQAWKYSLNLAKNSKMTD